MASSRKRMRADDDHDSQQSQDSERATSSFRQNNKRPRISMAQEHGGSTVSDDDQEPDLDDLINGLEDDEDEPGTDYAEEEEDDEIDETRASQYVQKGIGTQRENVASEFGVIEEVRCKNFMCHGNLRIKLGPLINFIIGHNGSGKSAVLTALTMCLGGKAAATNRGTSMKSMIKEGEEIATLSVKIKNRGEGAFKPDIYGTSITVERHFSRGGASGFKIKNAQDKTITTKKADLDDIVDYFALQIDNPINVLTQDMARQFLSNSTPEDKYKFFIKGTQLETLDADYKLLEEHLDGMEAKLRSRDEDMAGLRQVAEEAEKRKKRLDASQAIQDKIQQTRWMHAWAQVEEQERILANYERDVTMQQQKIEESTATAEDASGTYDGHNQAFEAACNHLETLQANVGDLETHWTEHKAAFDANTKELQEQRSQERRIKEDLNNHKSTKRRLEQEISEEEDRLNGAQGPQHAERLRQLEDLKDADTSIEHRIEEHAGRRPALQASKDEASRLFDEAKQPMAAQSKVLEKATGLVSSLQRDHGNKFAPFRPNMAQLVKAIDNETRWRKKPVGPMGLHIKLRQQQWSSQIEKTFGGVLDSFVCTNKDDQTILSQIMKRVNCAPQIYIGPDRPLDTTGKEPDEDQATILRVLDIDNDMVRNQLIINQAIEQTVLIPNDNEASDFMYSGQRPKNVKVAIAFQPSQRGGGIRFEFTRSGAAKSSPVAPWEGAARMQTDRAEQIRRAKENEDHAKHGLEELRQRARELQGNLTTAGQGLNLWERQNKSLRQEKQRADDAVERQENEIENNRPQDGKLQELQNQLRSVNDDIAATQRSYQDGVDWKDRLNEKATGPDGLKAKTDASLREYQTAKMQIDKANNRKDKLENDRQLALRNKNFALEQIQSATHRLQQFEERRDAHQTVVQEQFVSAAEQVCRRIPVEDGVTTDILDKRLDKFVADYDRAQAEAGGTREELTLAWRQAFQEYKEARGSLKEMKHAAKVSQCTFHIQCLT